MVEPGHGPLGVPLHLRRVSDPELLSDEVQNHHRNIQRILQERPHPADRHELKAEPELHVLAAMPLRCCGGSSAGENRAASTAYGLRTPTVFAPVNAASVCGNQPASSAACTAGASLAC
jgi:hypothetical protein